MAAPTLREGWVDWIAERLVAGRPSIVPAPPRLLAPCRDEPMPEKVVSALLLTSVAEPPAAAGPPLSAHRDSPASTKPADGLALAAPGREEGETDKTAADNEIAAPTEAPPVSEMEGRHNWLDWGATLGFALGMVAALIAGLTAVLRNGRLF
jgi:hypothetical protein